MNNMVKPILKWAGGKRQISDKILTLFPKDYKEMRFHEPMFGGGAITFNIKPEKGTINDVNPKLMCLYEIVKNKPKELIKENKKHKHDEDYYYDAREEFNELIKKDEENWNKVRIASLLLYLNRTCFNGLYRENSKGEFNVPFGSYSNPNFVQAERIRKCSNVLKNLKIFNKDFEYITKESNKRDLVYFDPPYQPVSETANFTDYSKEGFDFEEQQRLAEVCRKLSKNNVFFVLSNSWVKPIRELYENMEQVDVIQITANRDISCKSETRGEVYEILVTNVPEEKRRGKIQKTLKEINN